MYACTTLCHYLSVSPKCGTMVLSHHLIVNFMLLQHVPLIHSSTLNIYLGETLLYYYL